LNLEFDLLIFKMMKTLRSKAQIPIISKPFKVFIGMDFFKINGTHCAKSSFSVNLCLLANLQISQNLWSAILNGLKILTSKIEVHEKCGLVRWANHNTHFSFIKQPPKWHRSYVHQNFKGVDLKDKCHLC
jgi:hypothetical protein